MAEPPAGNGSLWRCTRCEAITDDCLRHNLGEHGTAIVAYNDFALRRGSLHDRRGARPALADTDVPLPLKGLL